jgi:GTP pyrophosphokinase
MEQMDTRQERIVAVLHDVAEDSEYTLRKIEDKFGEEISEAVEALTKTDDEEYLEDYIPRLVENPLARKVKKADLEDNLDVTRLSDVNDGDLSNIQKYHTALQKVHAATKGPS